VEDFVSTNRIASFAHRILFECSSRSGQSFITPDLAQDIAHRVYALLPEAAVIFSTDLPMILDDKRSRYAGTLSLRETAHLTHHCSLFVGAGSGGTGFLGEGAR
jgi:predicted TIM-barrel fold metal-dependent hydrolase